MAAHVRTFFTILFTSPARAQRATLAAGSSITQDQLRTNGQHAKMQLYVSGAASARPPRRYPGEGSYYCLIQVDLDR